MVFSGLKVQIAATLSVLLTLAILLGSVVFVAFWQKGLVRAEIEHIRSFWSLVLSRNSINQYPENAPSFDDLRTLCSYVGKHCVGVTLFSGEYWFRDDMTKIEDKSQNLAQESAGSKKEIIRLAGNPWGFLFFEKSYLLVAKPISHRASKKVNSIVVVLELDSIYGSIFKNHKAIFVYLFVNLILLTAVGFFRLIKITVKPVERMVRMSESYHDSDGLFFGGEEKRSEFGQLSMALNGMLYRIESDREKLRKTVASLEAANVKLLKTQKEMVRTEKMASVGILSAGLAHEIGNPIGIVQGYIELLQQPDLNETDKQQFVQRALMELDRINTLIRQLLDYAKSSTHDMSPVNLKQLVEEICQIVSLKKYNPPILLSIEIPADIYIHCDRESLRQVFLNCLLNAFDAIESKGGDTERRVTITAEKVVESVGGVADMIMSIKDTGTGIKEKDLEVIFDPFFTTKDPGKGTGLGLFVSHSIIDAHGGKIWMESTFGQGSTIFMRLPQYCSLDQKERHETSDH